MEKVYPTNGAGKIEFLLQKNKDSYISPCTKINSKWIKDLHVKPEAQKLLAESLVNTLQNMAIGKNVLNRTLTAQELPLNISRWDHMKTAKGNSGRAKSVRHGRTAFPTTLQTRA